MKPQKMMEGRADTTLLAEVTKHFVVARYRPVGGLNYDFCEFFSTLAASARLNVDRDQPAAMLCVIQRLLAETGLVTTAMAGALGNDGELHVPVENTTWTIDAGLSFECDDTHLTFHKKLVIIRAGTFVCDTPAKHGGASSFIYKVISVFRLSSASPNYKWYDMRSYFYFIAQVYTRSANEREPLINGIKCMSLFKPTCNLVMFKVEEKMWAPVLTIPLFQKNKSVPSVCGTVIRVPIRPH